MSSPRIDYQAFLKETGSTEVTSLVAYSETRSQPLRGIVWDVARKEWIYAPGLIVGLLHDDEYADEQMTVDRATAERLAREFLGTELPSEETILAMYEEGARNGWTYGPPRT